MSKDKVIWSDDEKAKIVGRAVALRDGNPSLSGLPLLREAVKGLPVDRQASPVSLAKAPGSSGSSRRREGRERVKWDPLPYPPGTLNRRPLGGCYRSGRTLVR